jgi:pentatricopeptide repeat protein
VKAAKPPQEFYLLALEAARTGRHPELADNIFKQMIESGWEPGVEAWASLIQCKAKGGYVDEALQQADNLKALGLQLPDKAYNSMISGLLECGRVSEAYKIFTKMKQVSTFSCAMRLLTIVNRMGCLLVSTRTLR